MQPGSLNSPGRCPRGGQFRRPRCGIRRQAILQ